MIVKHKTNKVKVCKRLCHEYRGIVVYSHLSINTAAAEKLNRHIDNWNIRVANEGDLMKRRADGFLELYATDYNHYFKETKKYKTQESRLLSLMRTIYEEFTNTNIREKYKYYDEEWKRKLHSLFESSPLNRPQVQNSFYGLETYQLPHQLLFVKLQNLFLKLQKLFEFAQKIDDMVEGLRKNHERVIAIFNKCKKKKIDNDLKYLMPALNLSALEPMFPDLVKDLQNLTFEEFIVKYYHELNKAEFAYIIPLYEKVLKESYGIEKDEASLYEDVLDIKEKIRRVQTLRVLMNHLDEFNTKGITVKGTKDQHYVSGEFIAMLMNEVKIPYKKGKEFVEEYFPKHYNGEYVPVKNGAVNKKRIDEKSEKYMAFKATANRLVADAEKYANINDKHKVSQNANIDTQTPILSRIFA